MKLNLYEVIKNWSGYSEGFEIWEVEAESEEEAEEMCKKEEGCLVHTEITRNDTKQEVTDVQLIQEGI